MSHKKKHDSTIPPSNRPRRGPGGPPDSVADEPEQPERPEGAPLQEQDEKRRFGNYKGAGEPSYKQPGGRNDADR